MRLSEYFIKIGNLNAQGMSDTLIHAIKAIEGVGSVHREGRSLVLAVRVNVKRVSKQALQLAIKQAGGQVVSFVRAEDEGLIEYDRVFAATLALLVLLYISAGSYQSFWKPWFVSSIPQPYGLLSLVISLTAIIWGLLAPLWLFGVHNLVRGRPNFCSIVSLAAGLFTIYSLYLVWFFIKDPLMEMNRLCFDVAGVFLVGAGWLLQIDRRTKVITKEHLAEALSRSLQQKVWIESEQGEPRQVVALAVNEGDQVVFASRQILCADGVLVGNQEVLVDEHVFSGQHHAVRKSPGDVLWAGSYVRSTRLVMKITGDSENTLLKRLTESFGGEYRVSQHLQEQLEAPLCSFMWLALFISLATGGVFFFNNRTLDAALQISLRIYPFLLPVVAIAALPLVRRESVRRALHLGLLLKGDEVLNTLASVHTVVINKEGIITDYKLEQPDFFCYEEENTKLYQSIILTMMQATGHRAFKLFYEQAGCDESCLPLDKLAILSQDDSSVKATYAGQEYQLADRRYLLSLGFVEDLLNQQADEYELEGRMSLYLVKNAYIVGLFVFKEVIIPHSVEALASLQAMGLNVVLFTSISQKSANALGRDIGVLRIYADLNAVQRMQRLKELQADEGAVVYVSVQSDDREICKQSEVAVTSIVQGKELLMSVDVATVSHVLTGLVQLHRFSQLYVRNAMQTSRLTYISILLFLPLMFPVFVQSNDSFLHSEYIIMLLISTLILAFLSSARLKMFK